MRRTLSATAALASGEVSVADGWGQVELAGITRLDNPVRAGGMPDLGEAIVDRDGLPVPDGAPGELVVTRPWAGLMVGLDAPSVLVDREYWERAPGAYATGDRARILPGGELEFLGRTDEVVSVSGQLVSLMEIRGLLADHPFVSAVDVIERRDHAGGRYIAAAVVLTPEAARSAAAGGRGLAAVARDLGESVRETLGGLAKPRLVMVVDRFGDELRGDERRRALAVIPVGDLVEPRRVTWAQVLAAAEYSD